MSIFSRLLRTSQPGTLKPKQHGACECCDKDLCHICKLPLGRANVVICKTCLELPGETETRFAHIRPSQPRQGD
jgi:hypothetical protein